eukprot:comp12849_c0_seq1/m.8014 comp12849_c0_seq1/g.8014  ORF comp12849_c0_seq1/g.8014 comp12849_c0_seq1/m.8014 type:complete len:360 (-) comp12849_c0_seq1:647-1726(-)
MNNNIAKMYRAGVTSGQWSQFMNSHLGPVSAHTFGPVLQKILESVKPLTGQGKVADYIPALARIDPKKFGMAVTTLDGTTITVGDGDEPFSIQSISKVLTTAMAMKCVGENLFNRVGVEPSGTPFNSLVQLESEMGKPRNPLINAGAIVVTDTIVSAMQKLEFPRENLSRWAVNKTSARGIEGLLGFVGRVAGKWQNVSIDTEVAESEKSCGFRNRALANFIRAFGNLQNPPEDVLDTYFHQCAMAASCRDLSRAFLFLANDGTDPVSREIIINRTQARRVLALMLTCGHYDASGQFAFRVGLPGKSGVGGGIVAIVPGKLSMAVWSPGLNKYGNSLAGTAALEEFTQLTGLSIFQPYI